MDGSSAPTSKHRILLVEDDLEQAHLVKFLLEDGGRHAVTHAQDGVRGTHLASDHRWDLVITDLNLPGVDGLAVLDASQAHHPNTPVLAITGYTGPEYAEAAMERGAAHVLIKPLQKDELVAKVDTLIAASPEPEPPPEGPTSDEVGASVPNRVLAIGIRPGDVEAGCGGTLLRHRDRGDRVVILTLTHGEPDSAGVDPAEAAKAAGRRMGVRFFVGNAGSGEKSLKSDLRRLVAGAIREIRPDVLYIPTVHHANPAFRMVNESVVAEGRRVATIFAYDPGDASPEFRPGFFVGIDSTIDEKLDSLASFGRNVSRRLDPEFVGVGATFWARYAEAARAEPLELLRGRAQRTMFAS